MLVDTHCHLYFDELKKDLDGVLSRAAALGVTKFICVGTNVEDSQHSYEPVSYTHLTLPTNREV